MPKGDTAIRAFYKYARLGADRRHFSPLEAPLSIKAYCSTDADSLRLLAVYDTLRILRAEGNTEAEEAVRAVYFSGLGKAPRKNDITYAVLRFAFEKNIDERTVWRRLEQAKKLYNSLLKESVCP